MKILKRLGIFILVIIITILLLLGGITYFYKDKIKNAAIIEANKYLNVKVSLSNIDVSGFVDFPNISVSLLDIALDESYVILNKKAIKAKELRFNFSIIDIIQGKVQFHEIILKNANINLAKNKTGQINYDFIKSDTSKASNQSKDFFLESIVLKDVNIQYIDYENVIEGNAFVKNSEFEIESKKEILNIINKGKIDLKMFKNDDINIKNKNLSCDFECNFNQKTKSIHIEKSKIGINLLKFEIKGYTDSLMMNKYDINSSEASISEIISLLPLSLQQKIGSITSTGLCKFNLKLKGSSKLKVDATFAIANGTIKGKKLQIPIDKINCNGTFNSTNDQLYLDIAELKAKNCNVKGTLNTIFGKQIKSDINLISSIDLKFFNGFFKTEEVSNISGLAKCNLKGQIVLENNNIDIEKTNLKGIVSCNQLKLKLPNNALDIEQDVLELSINKNELLAHHFKTKLNNTELDFNGKIENWILYILNKATLNIKGNLNVKQLKLENFYTKTTQNNKSETSAQTWIKNIDIQLNTHTQTFSYQNLNISNVNAKFHLHEKGLNLTEFIFNGFGGKNNAVLNLNQLQQEWIFDGQYEGTNVQISDVFKSFNNFDQSELTHQNINGNGNIICQFRGKLDSKMNVITPSIEAISNFEISNGQLKNYAPLYSLSKFIDLKELQNIDFETLKNNISIKNSTISIPKFEIKNSLVNLNLSGTHTFDNFMNYVVELSLAEVLAKRSGLLAQRTKARIEENGKGGLKTFIIMKGYADKLDIKYDKAEAMKQIKSEIKSEKQQFFKDLKKELNPNKTDENNTTKPIKKETDWDE